ncbi:MAG: hypothetical protein EBZ66_04605 [Actinobacteria bacterium]|nr:hypothetical protein [Actinomycetota bacterium]
MKTGEILLEVVRNDLVESVHSGHLLITDSSGKTILQLGDIDSLIYPRSAVKSIQASAMVRAGLRLSPKQLAVVCASHAGSSDHLETVKSILAGAGVDESSLKNTPDKPLGTAERLAWGDKSPTSLAGNCSGKHAGMVATCFINGWNLDNYKSPDHPLQKLIRKEFELLSGSPVSKIAVDGCGAPLFALSISDLSQAIRKVTISKDPIHQEVVTACRSNPVMVSGIGRLPTLLMEKIPGLFVKDGAEGVMVISLPAGETIVWKMSDGSQRGASALALASLSHFGVRASLDSEKVFGDGQVVGEIRASKLVLP